MRFQYDDTQAIAMGRYLRAASFPVIDPALTLAAYEGLIQLQLEKMSFLTPYEGAAVREMLERVLQHMLCLPASSTFHHRTAGGMFFHSLETASLAVEQTIIEGSTAKPNEALMLGAFIAGLLHDVGKVVATWHVYPQMPDIQDVGFGSLEPPELGHPRWDPHAESLWDWSRREGVTHLALDYQRSPVIGHEAAAANGFWRRFVPEEVFDAMVVRNPAMLEMLESHLERKWRSDTFQKMVQKADRISMERDFSPLYRTSPKRSDLHLVRRFIEFSAMSSWGTSASPFVMADLWVDGRDMDLRLPFFRVRKDFLQTFREYVLSEDMYGAAYRDEAADRVFCEILEKHDILCRSLPNCGIVARIPAEPQSHPAFRAAVQFRGQAQDEAELESLSYFPTGARMSWLNMPEVRVLL